MSFSFPHFPRHAVAAVVALAYVHASAQTAAFDIPAEALADALRRFAAQSGVQLVYTPQAVEGRRSQAVSGSLEAQAALAQLLRSTGLQARRAGATWTLEPAPANSGAALPEVTVSADAEPETATGPVRGYIARRSATATKTDTPLIETPQSISVVTADFIEATGALRVRDALAYAPGVNTMGWNDDSRFEWLYLRGFDAYSPGFFLDGLPLRNNSTWGVWRTENFGAERVELLRGPSSVLYGTTGPGGLVNVVTKLPTAEPQHELQVQLGDHARKQIAADFSGPLNADGSLLYRLTGVVRDAELPAGDMRDDRFYLAPSLTWRPSAVTSVTASAQILRDRAGVYQSGGPAYGTLLPNPNGVISAPAYYGEPSFDHFNHDQWLLGYMVDHQLNDVWTLRQKLRYGQLKVNYMQAWLEGLQTVNPADPADPANYRRISRAVFGSQEKAASFVVDNQAQAKWRQGDWQHTLLLGLDYQNTRFDQTTYYGGVVPTIDAYQPVFGSAAIVVPAPYVDARIKLEQTGLYLQDQIKWGERWVATLGGRYDRAKTKTNNHLDASLTQQSDGKFSGRAGLVYLAPEGWAPYVSYSESFVPTGTVNPETQKPFDPETGRQVEAGLRWQPPGRKDSYSMAAFQLQRRNYVTTDENNQPRVTGEVTVRGMEFEASIRPTPAWNVVASYTFLPKADVTASSNPAEIGKQLNPVARNQISVWSDYRFSNGIKAGLGVRYVGSNHGTYESTPVEVPAYTVFDAMLGYDFSSWSLALNARNLTNKAYLVACTADVSCGFGSQRTVVATATYRW
jgi:iron complex outermembrane receptor protein